MAEKPNVTYKDIGGMDIQKQEVREAIELPFIQHHLYTQIGIDPPRGVLLYGPPGTGKTMMAKAVANATEATFISMVGSEFVQKYLGEGPRMVRDVFRLARENSPCIVFIDEIDAIATKRFDAQTGADREVQRILLELLNQMDGFDQTTNVKVIMATNRADTLDPALLRPGRLDRKIEFPQPDRRQKRMVFQAATHLMNLGDELELEDYVNRSEKISHADISSICAEAGLQAVRENRYVVLPKDDIDRKDKNYIEAIFSEHGVLAIEDVDPLARLAMACPALPLCGLAQTEAERRMPSYVERIRSLLTKLNIDDEEILMRMTGCPNGCARPYMAEIAFVGDGAKSYQIWLGGSPVLTRTAFPYMAKMKDEDLEATLEPVLAMFVQQRQQFEAFGDFCHRLGSDAIEQYAKSYVPGSVKA